MAMPKYHWRPDLPGKHFPKLDPTKFRPIAIDFTDHMSPVENQGDIGSCTGNAIVGALEYLENKKAGFVKDDPNFIYLSRLYVYYNEREIEHTVSEDAGAVISDGINSLVKWGVCSEKLWPYNVAMFKSAPPPEAYTDGATRIIKTYAKVEQDEETLITTLIAGYPIIFGISVYSSFESDNVAATGLVPAPDVTKEACLGGHCILIVGYNSLTRLFKFRNSWSKEWGDQGYGYLPYDYVLDPDLANDFWVVSC